MNGIGFSQLPGRYAVVRQPAHAVVPNAILTAVPFVSVTRTRDELSIVCDESLVPPDAIVEKGWSVLKLHGPFAFDQIGILASCATPLARAGITIVTISTFDTDYILIKAERASEAIATLEGVGHCFVPADDDRHPDRGGVPGRHP